MSIRVKSEGAAGGYAAMAVLLLSLTGILLRYLLNYAVSPLCVAFWRNVVLCALLGLVLELFYPVLMEIRKKDFCFFTGFGAVLALFNLSWTFSVLLNGAAVATVLVYLSAVFSLLLGRLIFKESITRAKIVIVLCAMAGIVLITDNAGINIDGKHLVAVGCGIFSGFAYSLYSVGGRLKMSQAYNPWTMLFYSFLVATFWLAVAMAVGKLMAPGYNWTVFPAVHSSWWLALFLLAAGPTLFGFAFLNMALSGLPASTVNILLTAEPVLTIGWACWLLGENLSRCQWCGSFLIIGAVCWLSILEMRAPGMVRKLIPLSNESNRS